MLRWRLAQLDTLKLDPVPAHLRYTLAIASRLPTHPVGALAVVLGFVAFLTVFGIIWGTVSVTLELFDFGTPANITIPSDDEVQDVSSSVASKFSTSASSIGN